VQKNEAMKTYTTDVCVNCTSQPCKTADLILHNFI